MGAGRVRSKTQIIVLRDNWQYRTAYVLVGSDMFTLHSPTHEESFVADYLEHNGQGLHPIGVNVTDLDAAVDQRLQSAGR